ncbi:outer membrane beta-barrel protein [Vibrio sinaloensis]|uniref:outer membrane beta-barrel protein n=1 Tax=Photobacterium sp. (strain ATCC 43367) TaxID=379097 RepID=UPI00068E5942|nr:outer membrane beta-barrel protein [Vibrio sinaloensis]
MRNIILASILSFSAFGAFATNVDLNTASKPEIDTRSGFAIKAGLSAMSGDLGTGDTSSGVALGASYTAPSGAIIGVTYIPTAFEDSASNSYISASIDGSLVNLYGGYQWNSGWKLVGGLGLSFVEATVETYYDEASAEESYLGFVVGTGYDFKNGITLDAQLTTMDVEGVTGVNAVIMGGYKF